MLAAGSLLFFPGMGLVLWGRLALGRNYFVSTGIGAQLFADQQLVTTGPYAIVRHPMYTSLVLSALGALLMYTNYLDDCILLVIRPLSGSTRTARRTGIGG
jgi:protein-S-isoprenylcysteine O-methyltransferase Ste14